MFTKRYTTKSVNLTEQNIKAIPFEEVYHAGVSLAKERLDEQREVLVNSWNHQQERMIKRNMAMLSESLESTEGIEESIREASTSEPPDLSPDVTRKLRLEAYREVCDKFSEKYTLKARSSWLPAQLMAHFGRWKAVKEGDRFLAGPTVDAALGSADDWSRGIYFYVMFSKRGDWVDVQYKEPGSYYCSLVPFILAAFKKFHNIPYSAWSREGLSKIVEPHLFEAMTCAVPEGLDNDELLKIREVGMQIKTGKNAGGHRNPLTTYKLWGCQASLVGDLPWLAQVMLTQIWCAHPEARNEYMVLDPRDWDKMPERLISTDIFKVKQPEAPTKSFKNYTSSVNDNLVPWDL